MINYFNNKIIKSIKFYDKIGLLRNTLNVLSYEMSLKYFFVYLNYSKMRKGPRIKYIGFWWNWLFFFLSCSLCPTEQKM